ncbi:MAG: hypothetical protein V4598_17345 [Bdellovibrionota bacterium]
MNLLILEPPYSRIFDELTAKLVPKKAYAHIFNLGYILYLKNCKFHFVQKEIQFIKPSSESLEKVRHIKSLANSNVKVPELNELDVMARYYEYLSAFIKEYEITHILCHNDLRWQHALAKVVAKESNIKIFFSEEGLFRPDTMTLDSAGVNANSSVPRQRDFYLSTVYQPDENFKPIEHTYGRRILRIGFFGIFLMLNKIGDITHLNIKSKNKVYKFRGYLKLFLKKLVNKSAPPKNVPIDSPYIFVPLQVSHDTQTVVHSPFRDTQEFIHSLEESYQSLQEELKKKYKLVFKKHPMEEHVQYKFSNDSIISTNETSFLVQSAAMVILVNSTVIVDALKARKNIITLGNSLFNIDGLVTATNPNSLSEQIVIRLHDPLVPNEELLNSFLNYLKYNYQINGNIFYYNEQTIKSLASKVL